jgi:hypothetical protein
MDLMNLLDSTIEELADLQKFEPLPKGSYRLSVNWTLPEDDEFVIVQLKLTMLEVLQIPGIEDPELFPAVGKAATFYMRLQRKDGEPMVWKDGTANTQDQGRFKEVLLALAPVFNPDGSLSNRQMMEASEGAEVVATLGVRASKKDPDSKFNEIKLIAAA